MNVTELKEFLDEKVEQYNTPAFVETDPIQFAYRFTQKEDQEIIAFLVATIAWGKRANIIKSGEKMLQIMGNSPFDFIQNHSLKELKSIKGSIHRTFMAEDFIYFVQALQNLYKNHQGLEEAMKSMRHEQDTLPLLERFRTLFLELNPLPRTQKHLSSPAKNSAAKRINMYLRWMVRKDNKGVDLGIWNSISPAQLVCPLDVHVGNVGRKLGLLTRTQNDWKSVTELMNNLRMLDAEDPSKYDFALFGLGVFEGF